MEYRAEHEFRDADAGRKMVELIEELLMRKFPNLSREEIRAMFQLEDLRKTRVWQEAVEEGVEEGQTLAKKERNRSLIFRELAQLRANEFPSMGAWMLAPVAASGMLGSRNWNVGLASWKRV